MLRFEKVVLQLDQHLKDLGLYDIDKEKSEIESVSILNDWKSRFVQALQDDFSELQKLKVSSPDFFFELSSDQGALFVGKNRSFSPR